MWHKIGDNSVKISCSYIDLRFLSHSHKLLFLSTFLFLSHLYTFLFCLSLKLLYTQNLVLSLTLTHILYF